MRAAISLILMKVGREHINIAAMGGTRSDTRTSWRVVILLISVHPARSAGLSSAEPQPGLAGSRASGKGAGHACLASGQCRDGSNAAAMRGEVDDTAACNLIYKRIIVLIYDAADMMQGERGRGMALARFSEVAVDGCCPKCGYSVMKRGVTAVTRGSNPVGWYLDTWRIRPGKPEIIKCGGCGAKYLRA